MNEWMEDQPKAVLETLTDFCESGDIMSLVKGDPALLPSSCTSFSKIGFYFMIKQLKKTFTWMNKHTCKDIKAKDPKVFDKLIKLKYGLKKSMPMKGGLSVTIVEKFLLAVDKARCGRAANIKPSPLNLIDMQKNGIWGYAFIPDKTASRPVITHPHNFAPARHPYFCGAKDYLNE